MKTPQALIHFSSSPFSEFHQAIQEHNSLRQPCHTSIENKNDSGSPVNGCFGNEMDSIKPGNGCLGNKIDSGRPVKPCFENESDFGDPAISHLSFSATAAGLRQRISKINCSPQACHGSFENNNEYRRPVTAHLKNVNTYGRPAAATFFNILLSADLRGRYFLTFSFPQACRQAIFQNTVFRRPAIAHVKIKMPSDRPAGVDFKNAKANGKPKNIHLTSKTK